MDWAINIPFKDRDDHVMEAVSAARKSDLTEHEQQVVDVLARDAHERGIHTVGGLLDELGGLDREGARGRLDWAREKAGLISATESDKRRADARFESAIRELEPPPPPKWSPLQRCAICGTTPVEPSGAWKRVEVEKWHCAEHEHLAAEGDMDEHVAPYGFGVNGRLVPSEREPARLAEWWRQHEQEQNRERDEREQYARRKGEAIDQVRERFEEEAQVCVAGVRMNPGGVRVNL